MSDAVGVIVMEMDTENVRVSSADRDTDLLAAAVKVPTVKLTLREAVSTAVPVDDLLRSIVTESRDNVAVDDTEGYGESVMLRDNVGVVVTLELERFPLNDAELLPLCVPPSPLPLLLTDTI